MEEVLKVIYKESEKLKDSIEMIELYANRQDDDVWEICVSDYC